MFRKRLQTWAVAPRNLRASPWISQSRAVLLPSREKARRVNWACTTCQDKSVNRDLSPGHCTGSRERFCSPSGSPPA